MSSQEDKQRIRSLFLRLGERKDIPSNDSFWEIFWEIPKSASDIFEGISNTDIRSVCHTRNFVKLLRIVSLRFVYLANEEREMEIHQILNCMRILTRLLPYFYENPVFVKVELQVFWSANTSNQTIPKKHPSSTTATAGTIESASTLSNQDYDKASVEANLEFDHHSEAKSDKVEISLSDSNAPLGAQLVNTAVSLLFTRGFTVDSNSGKATNGIEFVIWEPGIGNPGEFTPVKIGTDSNRLEVMRFLLTLCSQCMYTKPNRIVSQGSRFLTVLVSSVPKLHILTLLSSLMNLVCRSSKTSPDNGLELGNNTLNHMRILTVTLAIQLLTLILVYPLPKDDIQFLEKTSIYIGKPFNSVRFYFGKLHKEQELSLIMKSLLSFLKQPMSEVWSNEQSSSLSSMIKSKTASIQPTMWGTESVMLLWELYQCNKKFKMHLVSYFGNNLMVILLYNICTFRKNQLHQNFVRVCSYFFLLLTSDQVLLFKLLDPFTKEFYERLPESFKITPSPVTYRDFLVTRIIQMLMADDININTPTLNECLFNLMQIAGAPEQLIPTQNRRNSQATIEVAKGYGSPGGGLSMSTSNLLCQLIVKYSAHRFLTGNESNLDFLALLIRAICQVICRFPKQSRCLIFTITKNAKYFENISFTMENMDIEESDEDKLEDSDTASDMRSVNDDTTHLSYDYADNDNLSDDDDEDEDNDDDDEFEVSDAMLRPKPPIGMSNKAKGKAPKHASLKRTWAGHTSFNIVMNFITGIRERVPEFEDLSKVDVVTVLKKIENLELEDFIESIAQTEYLPTKSNLEQLKFVWTNLSLGWYETILWRSIFASNEIVNHRFGKKMSLTTFSKVGTEWGFGRWSNSEKEAVEVVNRSLKQTNIWYGTRIRLFNSENLQAVQKGNLSDQIMRRFSDFKIGSPQSPQGPPQLSRHNSVASVASAPATPTIMKDDVFSEITPSIKVTPRNSTHRLSISSNFNSPRNLTRNNSTVTTPVIGSPRISFSA